MSVSSITTLDTTYTVIVDEVSSIISYVGEAPVGSDESGAVWRIRKLETTGTLFKIKWANGNQHFNNIWNDRASLTYI